MRNIFISIHAQAKQIQVLKHSQAFRTSLRILQGIQRSVLLQQLCYHICCQTGVQRFNDMATEASNSRLYGAIHYRSDCVAGLESGKKVGEYAVQRAMTDGAE